MTLVPRRVTVELTPQAIEQIAARVAQLLRSGGGPVAAPAAPQWITAKELARHLRVNPAWVYEHAEELGAIRTGSGPKARMRFELERAMRGVREGDGRG
jgi:hypothetical protein